MRTYLNFSTKKLVSDFNSINEFYTLFKNKDKLKIVKNYKNKKGRPFSIILPTYIKISPEVVGLIVGEGFIGKRHFVFANSNKNAINEVLKFLKQFNLPLRFYLEISVKNKSRNFVDKCILFWKNQFNIKFDRVRLRKEFCTIVKYGTLHVSLYNSLVAKLIKEIVNKSKKLMEKNKKFSINYLKGIIAAEGNINVKKSTKCIYMIRISASDPKEREHYKKCLKKAGIIICCKDMLTISKEEGIAKGWKTKHGRAGAVIISGWDNFIKIFLMGLLKLHEEKQKKFIKYFGNNKFTKQFLDFKYFLNKRFTMKEAQNYFGFKGRYLSRILTFYKKGYISRKRLNKNKFIYKLTPKYKKLFEKLKKEGVNII